MSRNSRLDELICTISPRRTRSIGHSLFPDGVGRSAAWALWCFPLRSQRILVRSPQGRLRACCCVSCNDASPRTQARYPHRWLMIFPLRTLIPEEPPMSAPPEIPSVDLMRRRLSLTTVLLAATPLGWARPIAPKVDADMDAGTLNTSADLVANRSTRAGE